MDDHFKEPDGDLPERLSEESWFVREIFIVKNSSFILYDLRQILNEEVAQLPSNFSTEEVPDHDSSNLKSNPPFGKSSLSSLFERGNLEMPGSQNGCLSS